MKKMNSDNTKDGEERIKIPEEILRELFESILHKKGSMKKLASDIGVPYSTLKKYKYGVLLFPKSVLARICKFSSFSLKDILKSSKVFPPNWGAVKGGKRGIKAVINKYGLQEVKRRQAKGIKKLKSWTAKNTKPIKKPSLNQEVSEFIGAHLGDGTLTKYFIRISLNSKFDERYLDYLKDLAENLFGLRGVKYKEKGKNVLNLRFCSIELSKYIQGFGLPIGDKITNKASISQPILENKNLFVSCLRGIFDTDGSLSKSGDMYSLVIRSHNETLIENIKRGLKQHELTFFSYFYNHTIGTRSKDKIIKFFSTVGSANIKHIVKFILWRREGKILYNENLDLTKDWIKNLSLPFKWADGLVV